MHLIDLGIVKKLLMVLWMPGHKTSLNKTQISRISQRLMNFSKQIPVEFQRITRSLDGLSNWHAVEFRFFHLYSGFFVLKDILPNINALQTFCTSACVNQDS